MMCVCSCSHAFACGICLPGLKVMYGYLCLPLVYVVLLNYVKKLP